MGGVVVVWTAVFDNEVGTYDLEWIDGPQNWPEEIIQDIDEAIEYNKRVPLTETGPSVLVSWADERSIIAYLGEIGRVNNIVGDRPSPVPPAFDKRPPGGPPLVY